MFDPSPLARLAAHIDVFGHVVAQAIPDTNGQWISSLISGLGSAGLSTGILWVIHNKSEARHEVLHLEDRKTIQQLTSRLFLLADRATEVGQTAAEVVKAEAADPELMAEMQRLVALIEERSR